MHTVVAQECVQERGHCVLDGMRGVNADAIARRIHSKRYALEVLQREFVVFCLEPKVALPIYLDRRLQPLRP